MSGDCGYTGITPLPEDHEFYFVSEELAKKVVQIFTRLHEGLKQTLGKPNLSIKNNPYFVGGVNPDLNRTKKQVKGVSNKASHLRNLLGRYEVYVIVSGRFLSLFERFLKDITIEFSDEDYRKLKRAFEEVSMDEVVASLNRIPALSGIEIPGTKEVSETFRRIKNVSKVIEDSKFFLWLNDWELVLPEDKRLSVVVRSGSEK